MNPKCPVCNEEMFYFVKDGKPTYKCLSCENNKDDTIKFVDNDDSTEGNKPCKFVGENYEG